jgi:hypothetical protein
MAVIDCTIKLSDVKTLTDLIAQKILSDKVVRNYLCEAWESFSINSKNQVLVEWSIRDYLNENGEECCETGYIRFSELLDQLEEKDYIPVCERLVRDCERIFYDVHHDHSSDALPLKLMMAKVRRLGFGFKK